MSEPHFNLAHVFCRKSRQGDLNSSVLSTSHQYANGGKICGALLHNEKSTDPFARTYHDLPPFFVHRAKEGTCSFSSFFGSVSRELHASIMVFRAVGQIVYLLRPGWDVPGTSVQHAPLATARLEGEPPRSRSGTRSYPLNNPTNR